MYLNFFKYQNQAFFSSQIDKTKSDIQHLTMLRIIGFAFAYRKPVAFCYIITRLPQNRQSAYNYLSD